MFAFEFRLERREIDADQVGGQTIDGRLISIVAGAAAADFGFVIAGEESFD